VEACFGLLARFPNLIWSAPDLQIADTASRLRAENTLKTPDALQAGSAIAQLVRGFATNAPVFRRVTELDVLLLDDLL